jgi:hypothetical protein
VEEQLGLHQQHLKDLEMRLSKHAYSVDLVEEVSPSCIARQVDLTFTIYHHHHHHQIGK